MHSLAFFLLAFVCYSSAQVPKWPQTWRLNESTIIMPCNNQGFMDPKTTTYGWGIIDFDWSNAKAIWAKAHPMNCAELLLQQLQMTHAGSPSYTKTWLYRNTIKALPWFTKVRETLEDPAYSPWFMKFNPNASSYHVPVCDNNYNPPLCSKYYHDQEQTPGYPHGDGDCAPPACDVGKIPVGEYLWDYRAWNVSVKGKTFGQWFIDYVFDETGGANPLVLGFYFDDAWTMQGPTEYEAHAVEDMGLSTSELADLTKAYNLAMQELYTTVTERGRWSWQQLQNVHIESNTCLSTLRSLCKPSNPLEDKFLMYSFFLQNNDPSNYPQFEQDLANFLLIRGPYAAIGTGWIGCDKKYPFPARLNSDFGEPVDASCREVSSGVFTRSWSKADVQMDCNTFTPKITQK